MNHLHRLHGNAANFTVVLSVRVLSPADWPAWRDVGIAALTEAPHAFKSRLADWERGGADRWRARLELPGSHNVVAELDGQTVGVASGVPAGDGISELRSVWVSLVARGRGVADRLVANVANWATRSGATTLKLAVLPGNEPAVAMYRRNGFVPSDELGELLPDGVSREQVMVKALR